MRRRMAGSLKIRFQAPERVGPPIKNQGPSDKLDRPQAMGYNRIYVKKRSK
jgi:hypothetical protein